MEGLSCVTYDEPLVYSECFNELVQFIVSMEKSGVSLDVNTYRKEAMERYTEVEFMNEIFSMMKHIAKKIDVILSLTEAESLLNFIIYITNSLEQEQRSEIFKVILEKIGASNIERYWLRCRILLNFSRYGKSTDYDRLSVINSMFDVVLQSKNKSVASCFKSMICGLPVFIQGWDIGNTKKNNIVIKAINLWEVFELGDDEYYLLLNYLRSDFIDKEDLSEVSWSAFRVFIYSKSLLNALQLLECVQDSSLYSVLCVFVGVDPGTEKSVTSLLKINEIVEEIFLFKSRAFRLFAYLNDKDGKTLPFKQIAQDTSFDESEVESLLVFLILNEFVKGQIDGTDLSINIDFIVPFSDVQLESFLSEKIDTLLTNINKPV